MNVLDVWKGGGRRRDRRGSNGMYPKKQRRCRNGDISLILIWPNQFGSQNATLVMAKKSAYKLNRKCLVGNCWKSYKMRLSIVTVFSLVTAGSTQYMYIPNTATYASKRKMICL